MRTKRRTIPLPNFEACSVVLIAFAALINAPAARAQVGFGPGPAVKSAPAKTTASQVVTPARSTASTPKPAVSGTKPAASGPKR